jgi:hypothetical protein
MSTLFTCQTKCGRPTRLLNLVNLCYLISHQNAEFYHIIFLRNKITIQHRLKTELMFKTLCISPDEHSKHRKPWYLMRTWRLSEDIFVWYNDSVPIRRPETKNIILYCRVQLCLGLALAKQYN